MLIKVKVKNFFLFCFDTSNESYNFDLGIKNQSTMAKKKLDKKEMVTITCYNQKETMTRGKAIAKYFDAMCNTEGSEQERYVHIYQMLMEGATNCYDC